MAHLLYSFTNHQQKENMMDPSELPQYDPETQEIEEFDMVVDELINAETCLSEAATILGKVSTQADVSRASALISLGRELRIGKKNRYTAYGSVHRKTISVGRRVVLKQQPATVSTQRDIFADAEAREVAAEAAGLDLSSGIAHSGRTPGEPPTEHLDRGNA